MNTRPLTLLARLALLPCAWLAACSSAHYAINPPLATVNPDQGYRLQRYLAQDPDDSLLLHVSFSGGGLRAATLGLGVLDALRDTHVHWEGRDERLFDQVDIVMGLSGGSLLTGALALGGEPGLARFEQALLQGRPQGEFTQSLFTPASLWRLTSPHYGRSDAFEQFLDERLFHGIRYGDLSRQPRKPFAVIYASDMVNGGRFEFVQEQFDFLCSDLDGVKLARAVAASSAVPLVLSPVTFWNHVQAPPAQDCGTPLLRQAAQAQPGAGASRRLAELDGYRDLRGGARRRPYVHLIDGGLADIPIHRNSDFALSQMRATVQAWHDEVRQAQARGEDIRFAKDVQFHLIEVSLDAPDPALTERLRASRAFQAMVQSLQPAAPVAPGDLP